MIWLGALVGFTGYSCFLCAQLLQNYFSYPTSTKTSIVKEIPTQFPKISFCNIKSLDSSNNLTITYLNLNPGIDDEDSARTVIGNDKNLTDEVKKEMSFNIEDMLVYCYFNFKYCNASDFKYFYSSSYGNCYSFNSGFNSNGKNQSIKNVNSGGYLYGLQLTLYLGDPSVDLYHTYSAGVVVSIDNQTTVPFTQNDLIKVGAKTNTDLIVNRNFNYKLPYPYGYCLDDSSSASSFSSKYFDYIVKTKGYNYSEEYCYSLCIQQQNILFCGCANIWIPSFDNSSSNYCSTTVELDCVFNLISLKGDNFTDECSLACPFTCFSIDYNVVSHSALYPNFFESNDLYQWAQSNGKTISLTEVAESYLQFNVFYHNMQYSITQDIAQMQVADVISNFGGIVSMFIGITFFIVIAIIDLVWKLLHVFVTFYSNKRKASNNVVGTILDGKKDIPAFQKAELGKSNLDEIIL